LTLAIAGSAGAAKPATLTFPLEADFAIPHTTAVCGVEARISIDSTVTVRLFTGSGGTVVREIDLMHGERVFYSPETGESFRFPEASSWHFDYPDGAAVGARVEGHLSGIVGRGGNVTDAGQLRVEGVVVGTAEVAGITIPLVDFWPVRAVGSLPSEDEYMSGRCEALGGSYQP
jgi:hypothetical protein